MINKDELAKEIGKANNIAIFCDYLRLRLNSHYEITKKLDLDNSNFEVIIINGIELTKIKIKLNLGLSEFYHIVYKSIVIPIFMICDFDLAKKKLTNSFGKIDVFGSYYRLVEIGYLEPNFIEDCLVFLKIKDFKKLRITRLDVKIDFLYKGIEPINTKLIKYGKQTKTQTFMKGNNIESFCVGNRQCKREFAKIYDKKVDTMLKGKQIIYQDYYKYATVRRLEIEYLYKCFKRTDIFGSFDNVYNRLKDVMLGNSKIMYEQKKYIFEDYSSMQYNSYVKKWLKQGEKIAKLGLNPYQELYNYLNKSMNQKYHNYYVCDFKAFLKD